MIGPPLVRHVAAIDDIAQGYPVVSFQEALYQDREFRVRQAVVAPLHIRRSEEGEVYVVVGIARRLLPLSGETPGAEKARESRRISVLPHPSRRSFCSFHHSGFLKSFAARRLWEIGKEVGKVRGL